MGASAVELHGDRAECTPTQALAPAVMVSYRLHGRALVLAIMAMASACGTGDAQWGLIRTVPVSSAFGDLCVLHLLEGTRTPGRMECRDTGRGFLCRNHTVDREYYVASVIHAPTHLIEWGLAPQRRSTRQERRQWTQQLDAMYESWRASCPAVGERGSIRQTCRGPYCASW